VCVTVPTSVAKDCDVELTANATLLVHLDVKLHSTAKLQKDQGHSCVAFRHCDSLFMLVLAMLAMLGLVY